MKKHAIIATRAPRHEDKNALPKLIETHLGQKYGILVRIKKYVCNVHQSITNGIFLLLGTNLGDRRENLAKARDLLRKNVGPIVLESSIYSTKAWGYMAQPDFLNQVMKIETSFPPAKLLESVLSIESELGRVRVDKWGPRVIDIDILFYNDLILDSPTLCIPHPALHERRFTMVPLAEIAPTLVHPVLGKQMEYLLRNCTDQQSVERFQ